MEQLELFKEIKNRTNGYLDANVYKKIYDRALQVPEGVAFDIGPAQGASSISLSLAARDGKRLHKVYSMDVFKNSAALKSYENVEENIKVHYDNLKFYGVEQFDEARVVGRDNCLMPEVKEMVSVLFIDADGALDRDFENYYNRLSEGAVIVIDDCERTINLQSRTRFLKWQSDTQIRAFLKSLNMKALEEYAPLGKQYTTYRFVKYFKEHHFIDECTMVDDTLFARKPANASVFTDQTKKDLLAIRKEIVEEYEDRHSKVTKIYERIAAFGIQIAEQLHMGGMFLFENYDYKLKNRKQTVKVYEWHRNNGEMLENDMPMQDICFTKIPEFVEPLCNNRIMQKRTGDLKEQAIKAYLQKLDIEHFVAVPVFVADKFWGCVFCFCTENAGMSESDRCSQESSCYTANDGISKVRDILDKMVVEIEKNSDQIHRLTTLTDQD